MQELNVDSWGFMLFISMEMLKLCAKAEIDTNVEFKEHKLLSWTQTGKRGLFLCLMLVSELAM